jgi:hypothetical protein
MNRTEIDVRFTETSRTSGLDIVRIETEPVNWQRYLSPGGSAQWLKPDLYAITAVGDFEDHRYIQEPTSTPNTCPRSSARAPPTRPTSSAVATQARHGVFPIVIWVVPTTARAESIRQAVIGQVGLTAELFRVCTIEQFVDELMPPTP